MKLQSKNFLCLLLLSLLLISCGCGGQEPASTTSNSVSESAVLKELTDYTVEFTTLAEGYTRPLTAACSAEHGFYTVDWAFSGEEEKDTARIRYQAYTGRADFLQAYRPVEAPEELASLPNFYASHNLLGLAVTDEGMLIALENLYMSWYAGKGERQDGFGTYYDAGLRQLYIRKLDQTGKALSTHTLPQEIAEKFSGGNISLDSQENLLFAYQNQLYIVSLEGELQDTLAMDGYIFRIETEHHDNIAVFHYLPDGGEQITLLDPASHHVLQTFSIPAGMRFHTLIQGSDFDLGFSDGLDYYVYSFSSGQSTRLFHWFGCGLDPDTVIAVQLSKNGSVRCVLNTCREDGSYALELAVIKPIDSEKAGKTVLHLGSIDPDHELKKNIVEYNRSQAEYCIELTDYSQLYDLNTEGQQGRVMRELISGNLPDILDLRGIDHRLLAAKGCFLDLNPLLNNDREIQRRDLFPALLEACSCGSTLYAIAPGFSVETVLGSAELLGTAPGWNYDEYWEALSLMGPNCQPFEVYTTSEDMMRTGLCMEMDRLVDWPSLTADFEQDRFIRLLEYAGSFPDSFDWESYSWSDADIVEYRLAQGRQMLLRVSLHGIDEIGYKQIYFDGKVSYIGYPTIDGSPGCMMDVDMGYAIGSQSREAEAAWQFLRRFLSPDQQKNYAGFPANRRIFLENLEQAMIPQYLTDEQGNSVLGADGEPIEVPQGNIGTVLGVWNRFSVSEEQAMQLSEVLDRCIKRKSTELELLDIVMEKCRLYFDAQRSAQQTAALVQQTVEEYFSTLR